MERILYLAILVLGMELAAGQERRPMGPREVKVELPKAEVTLSVEGEFRYIESNGLPNHETGEFPGPGNPHAIRAQQNRWRVPANPQFADEPTPLGRHPFGVALNGVPFDPGTAEYWNRDPSSGWRYEALTGHQNLGIDHSNAHVQPSGAYHYHGLPHGILHTHETPEKMELLGYAADGFPIYSNYGYAEADDPKSGLKKMRSSWKVKEGSRPTGTGEPGGEYDGRFTQDWEYIAGHGDLDAFNGRYGPTPEYPEGTYHYYITDEFPFVPRMYKGTPDPSFTTRRGPRGEGLRRPGGPRGQRGPRGPGRPRDRAR